MKIVSVLSLSESLSNLQLADFAEVITINRNRNSQWEHFGTAKKSPEHDLPILESLPAEDPQADARTQYCQYSLKIEGGSDHGGLILPEEGHRSFVVVLRRVNVVH